MQTSPATVHWWGTGTWWRSNAYRSRCLSHRRTSVWRHARRRRRLCCLPAGRRVAARDPSRDPLTVPATHHIASPTPYMRCVNDFWGNCTGVASNRHDYRWRYVKPGARPRDLRESPTARESTAASRATRRGPRTRTATRENGVAQGEGGAAARKGSRSQRHRPRQSEYSAARQGCASRQAGGARKNRHDPGHHRGMPRQAARGRRRASLAATTHDARPRTAGWARFATTHGERYQDINRAKDVRHVCGPSSISIVLKTPHFRCVVEATPCRATQGTPTEPDERRYDPPIREDQISRK